MCECLEYADGDAYVCEACWPMYQEAMVEYVKNHKDAVGSFDDLFGVEPT
jgi:hypothetical protein